MQLRERGKNLSPTYKSSGGPQTPPRVIILSVSKAFPLFATQLIVLSSLNCLGNTSFPKEVDFGADFDLEKVRHWLASFKTTENSVFVDLT